MISRPSSQLISRQSGLGCDTSQVGNRARPASEKSHVAAADRPGFPAGLLFQRIRKRYAQRIGTNHPKLYSGSMAQYCESCAMSMYQSAPKTTKGKIHCVSFACCQLVVVVRSIFHPDRRDRPEVKGIAAAKACGGGSLNSVMGVV